MNNQNYLDLLDNKDVSSTLFREISDFADNDDEADAVFDLISCGIPMEYYYFAGNDDDPLIFFCPAEYDKKSDVMNFSKGMKKLGFHVISFSYLQKNGEITRLSHCFPLVENIYNDFLTRKEEIKINYNKIFIMGRSFGASLALNLAAFHNGETTGLILESAFDRFDVFIRRQGVSFPEGVDPTHNKEKMRCFTKPVLFLHSSRDTLQSLTEIEWLVLESRSKGTQFQIMPSPDRRHFLRLFGDTYLEFIKQFIWQKIGRRPKKRYSNHPKKDEGYLM